MRLLTLATGFFISVATLAQAGIILPISRCSSVFCAAPAPSIGTGVPVALAAGAVLSGMMLVKLWRRS